VSSRRESPAVPPTRDAQERCVGCALSGALRTREGNGTDTPLGRDSPRTDAVSGHRAPRTPRVASPCGAADSRAADRRAYDGFCTGVSRSSYSRKPFKVPVAYKVHMATYPPACHSPCISRADRRHTKHNSRVHHRDPYVGTVAHDIARHASRMATCAHTARAHTCVHALGRPPRPTQPRT